MEHRSNDTRTQRATRHGAAPGPPIIGALQARGFRWLYVLDAVALFGVMCLVMLVRFGTSWPSASLAVHLGGFGAATAVHLFVYYFGGLYDRTFRLGRRMWLGRIAGLTVVALAACALVILPTDRYPIPRGNLPFVGALVALAVTGNRHLSRILRSSRYGPPRVMLVGNPDDMALAAKHLAESDRDARVVAQTTDPSRLVELAEEHTVTDVMLVSETSLEDIYPEPLSSFETNRKGVYLRVTAKNALMGLRNVRQIGGMPYVTLLSHTLPPSKVRFKRACELVLLVALTPILVIVTGLTALYVLAVAGRPLFYRQARTGFQGRPFSMVKFRTMYPDAEDHTGAVMSSGTDDPRVIPACRWLRSTRLDELPQFWNVTRGEMSIIGPRPERPEMTEQFSELIPGYERRHEIPPGITGLAQVRGRYDLDPAYKLGHDIQYLVNWSPVLDLQILARTLWVMATRRG
jgi:exopolysaccharide biosynthesis polyprenyl glycosylphosphotransferase